MKKNMIILLVVTLLLGLGLFALRANYYEDQARFNVDVLDRFIRIFYMNNGRFPEFLSELPAFHVVSYKEGLALELTQLKRFKGWGYSYHYELREGSKYVLSASPYGVFSGKLEFGSIGDGQIRRNDYQVDPGADKAEEVTAWEVIGRARNVITR